MIPRLDISFPLMRQWQYWFGKMYEPADGEYLLNHARTGIVMALRTALPDGGRVGVVAYNCHTVANAVVNAGCEPVFVDVTENLKINVASILTNLDAIVVTNLFGIRNDVEAIRKRCPKAVLIVDNAHGYGLPAEGDFTVYSINQGKFPALGEGGLLTVNGNRLAVKGKIDELYKTLPKYGFIAQCKLFFSMLVKAVAYSQCIYWLTMRIKKSSRPKVHQGVVMRQMAPGIRRLYKAWLSTVEDEIAKRRANAAKIADLGYETIMGENAFMAIIRTNEVAAAKADFAKRGIETETHFGRAIEWAKEFGYESGSCPMAEQLTKELLMIPTYRSI